MGYQPQVTTATLKLCKHCDKDSLTSKDRCYNCNEPYPQELGPTMWGVPQTEAFMLPRAAVSRWLTCFANWLDGSGWNYDEFDHGFREGIKYGYEQGLKEGASNDSPDN